MNFSELFGVFFGNTAKEAARTGGSGVFRQNRKNMPKAALPSCNPPTNVV
jgi:hypothetical protein